MFKFLVRFRKKFRSVAQPRGVSLIIVLGLVFAMMALSAGAIKVVIAFMKTTNQVERANIAYFAAEGGVELALYDLVDYEDGYEVSQKVGDYQVCGDSTAKNSAIMAKSPAMFSANCSQPDDVIRFTNFSGNDTESVELSDGRGFWRLFSNAIDFGGSYVLPNPYFAGDKDGVLENPNGEGNNEWGEITKISPVSYSLLSDANPSQSDPSDRYKWPSAGSGKHIVFDPGTDWDPDYDSTSEKEALMTWTFSAIDGNSDEFTLQGVVWESDFVDACGDGRNTCFDFDLGTNAVTWSADGDVFAGEDINRNLPSAQNTLIDRFNRVSGINETFDYATPSDFVDDLNSAMAEIDPADQWESVSLTFSLINTLSETSGVASNSLRYKFTSDEDWADNYTYIISEGYAKSVKQTIETRFKRASTIPIFSYVIFQ